MMAQQEVAETTVSKEELEAIRQTALDYTEGWYEGSAERIERALHFHLAKRSVVHDAAQGMDVLRPMSGLELAVGAREGGGREIPTERQQKDVTVLDVFENVASVKVVASDWIDYVHMAKMNGRWVIVNVLWAWKPGHEPK
jgi:hypothetical protein